MTCILLYFFTVNNVLFLKLDIVHPSDKTFQLSEDGRVIFRKATIEIDYEKPDDAWKSYSHWRLADDWVVAKETVCF